MKVEKTHVFIDSWSGGREANGLSKVWEFDRVHELEEADVVFEGGGDELGVDDLVLHLDRARPDVVSAAVVLAHCHVQETNIRP